MIKKIYIAFSVLFLVYMIWPSPGKVSDFAPLPNSDKSTLEGDTIQIPNVSAYFSDNFRDFAVSFYRDIYQNKTFLFLPPLTINHPPEYSWVAIKRHTDSTYIEELVYPLRDSLYVNGFEPFYSDGSEKFWGSTKFEEGGNLWFTKTTLRYYPSNVFIRLIVWVGVLASIFALYKTSKEVMKT